MPQFVRILRHYPLGRLAAFLYIIGVHLFIYVLLHRRAAPSPALPPLPKR